MTAMAGAGLKGFAALMLIGAVSTAGAYDGESRYRTANVVRTIPIYETVRVFEPHHTCREERVVYRERGHDGRAGLLVGGIIGGVVGNQFGDGSGRTAATVAGSVLGAAVGDRLSRGTGRTRHRIEQHCHEVDRWYEEDRIVAYRVQYRYQGDRYWTEMAHDPGDRIRVRVDVTPID